jgi:hypothetical protein
MATKTVRRSPGKGDGEKGSRQIAVHTCCNKRRKRVADAQTRCFPNWANKWPGQFLGKLLRRIRDPRGLRIPR